MAPPGLARLQARLARCFVPLLLAAGIAAAQFPPAAQAAGPMGINPNTPINTSTGAVTLTQNQVNDLAAAGVGWVRLEFITGPYGNTDSTAFYNAYDQIVNMFVNAGIQVLGLVDYQTEPGGQSAWTQNNQENTGGNGDNNYIVGLGAITARIAQHYAGKITWYEVWNEPNAYASCSGSVCTGGTFMYPSNFAALLTEVYAQSRIYANIPVKFVSGGVFGHSIGGVYDCTNAGGTYLSNTYNEGINITGKFTWAYQNDGGNYPLDAIGQHIYITQGGTVTTSQIQQYLGCIRSAYTAYDSSNKKVWITEFGWNTYSVSQATQAANIDTSFGVFQSTSYVSNALLYNDQDWATNQQWGIWMLGCSMDSSSCQKQSYATYQNDTTYQGRYSNKTIDQNILNVYNQDGMANFGSPFDNGGGPWVHWWDYGYVQDVEGGAYGPAIIMDGSPGTYFINYGFRTAYLSGSNHSTCEFPTDNAYSYGSGTRQDFQGCYMTWDPTNGVVVH
jgi:hypothetical protein